MAQAAPRDGEGAPSRTRRYWVRPLLALCVLALAGVLLYRAIGRYGGDEIAASIRAIPPYRLILAGVFAAASYACLTCFDALAVRYAGYRIPYRYVAMTSFASLSLGHNIGFAALSSGAIRYRLYSRYGVSAGGVARIIVFCGVTVGLGLEVLGGGALCWRPDLAEEIANIRRGAVLSSGAACLVAAAGYFLFCATVRRSMALFGWRFYLPSPGLAAGQLVIGPLNFAFVAACLHQAIAGVTEIPYAAVVPVYVVANLATLVSHVPGGLGVIESVVLTLLPGASVIGALIVFRIVYFLTPLVLGSALLAIVEMFASARKADPVKAGLPTARRK